LGWVLSGQSNNPITQLPNYPITKFELVHSYHDATKHQFGRFARSLGYLDWASQPAPFRSFDGAPVLRLFPDPAAHASFGPPALSYDDLFASPTARGAPINAAAIGCLLRHALGLSAWKQAGGSRWSLRVNPSSGNLHPTEAYVIAGQETGLHDSGGVFHYAPDRHVLEQRARFSSERWRGLFDTAPRACFIALTSIHWRESWKYGERAFRYCQHDLGHAIAAVRFAASLLGWSARIMPEWPHRAVASLAGIDRAEDFTDAEREEPACLIWVSRDPDENAPVIDVDRTVQAVRGAEWFGRASQLSEDHVTWSFIDDIARATEDAGISLAGAGARLFSTGGGAPPPPRTDADASARISSPRLGMAAGAPTLPAQAIILKRRSALAFDGRSSISRAGFIGMLERTMPGVHAPWDALWWTPRVHLAVFVHRVNDMDPGLYLLVREPQALERLKQACGREFSWDAADDRLPLWCLARGDARRMAQRLSCDQEIAADGFFSLGMIAEFDRSLAEYGTSFYRQLFWETGVVGQVLYLEAEAAGARGTGIGCFYDDPVHEALGLRDREFQSLYHFTVGMPVEDPRLTTEPGYGWELPSDNRGATL
jgi:SagB-type dehydrogenase family enzyme